MAYNANPIPVEDMPKNIHELLTEEDYTRALFHPMGFQKGIFDVIHLNKSYRQWNNIIMNANNGRDTDIVMYTRDGWVVRSVSYIWELLNREYVLCFDYLDKNREKFWPNIDDYDSEEDDPKVEAFIEKVLKRTPEEEAEDKATTAFCDIIAQLVRVRVERDNAMKNIIEQKNVKQTNTKKKKDTKRAGKK
jgi:hypothetical protein